MVDLSYFNKIHHDFFPNGENCVVTSICIDISYKLKLVVDEYIWLHCSIAQLMPPYASEQAL